MNIQTALYLIPVNISNAPFKDTLPEGNSDVIRGINHFIVENIRTARRFLKKIDPGFDIAACTFYELNRHTDTKEIHAFIEPLRQGMPVGVMSEAGCPAVADPGSDVVAIAQREGLRIVPLVGPSSILLALMGSGFNGQGFSFNGYLPIESKERERKIRELESISRKTGMTQIFIETPYRNNRMLETLARTLHGETLICVACDVTDPEGENIITMPAKKWLSEKRNYDKRPAIFLLKG